MKPKISNKQKELFRFNLAGVQYSDYQQCSRLKAGAKLTLTWERNNPHDNKAIRVNCDGVKLGYVPANTAFQNALHSLRQQNSKVEATVVAFNKTNPTWNMICIKVCGLSELVNDSDYIFTK